METKSIEQPTKLQTDNPLFKINNSMIAIGIKSHF